MPGYGTSAGIGIGIGEGLGSVADALMRRRAQGREDRDKRADELLTNAKAIAANRAQIAAANPKDESLANLDKQGQELISQANALYQPHEKPAFMAKIQGLFHGGQQQKPATPRYSWDATAAAAPLDRTLARYNAERKDKVDDFRTEQGIRDESAEKAAKRRFEEQKTLLDMKPDRYQPQLSETTDAQGVKHYWRVPLASGQPPEEVDFKGQKVTPKGNPQKPVRAFTRKGGKIVSVLIDPVTNKPIPGSENPDILPPAGMSEHVSTGTYHWVDGEGNLHATQETRVSGPAGSGGVGPQVPKTPGDAKKAVDTVMGNKGTPASRKADGEFFEASKIAEFADNLGQLRAKGGDVSAQDKLLVEQLVKAASGRFSQASYENIVGKMGLGNKLEQWKNNLAAGGQLPDNVRNQLIQAAHDLKAAAGKARDGLKPKSSGGDGVVKWGRDAQGNPVPLNP